MQLIHLKIRCFLILLSLQMAGTSNLLAQTPAPKTGTSFLLNLIDGTTATAVFLPMQDGQVALVYATRNGNLGLWTMTPTISPAPQPPIPPNPNPVPPTPVPPQPITQKLSIGIVEDPRTTTLEQKAVLIDKEWRNLAVTKHEFIGLIPKDIKEKQTGLPPANLLPFLNAAKGHELPYVVFFDKAMSLVYSGPLPDSSAEMTALILKYGG